MSDTDEQRLIGALRRDRSAEAPDRARVRVTAKLDMLDGLRPRPSGVRPASTTPDPSIGPSPRATGSTLRVLAAFVVGAGVGALLHARFVPQPAPRIVTVERPAASPPDPPSASAPIPAASAPIPAVSAPGPEASAANLPASPAVRRPQSAETPPTSAAGLAQLDAERALLDAAHTALVAGESDTALRALERHARTFAHPILGEEREALCVQALAAAGRDDDARARAQGFRRRWPGSVFLPAVNAAVASLP